MKLFKVIVYGWKYIVDKDFRFLIDSSKPKYANMPDEEYLKLKYHAKTKKELNLDDPKTYNEKIQWLKLYNRRKEYTKLVDKYEVRKYIADTIGDGFLIPLIGVWNSADDIDFDQLPNQFVLKCTHNSGLGMCICKNKNTLDLPKTKRKLQEGLKENYYMLSREWPYKNVVPRIICEKYMTDESGVELKDYKVMCFDGEPKLIELHQGRFTNKHTQDFYDTSWNRTSITQCGEPLSDSLFPKPVLLDKMLELSRVLAKGMPHVRVDWYIIDGKLYFGEITFFDASGFDPFDDPRDDLLLGSWITLPSKTLG